MRELGCQRLYVESIEQVRCPSTLTSPPFDYDCRWHRDGKAGTLRGSARTIDSQVATFERDPVRPCRGSALPFAFYRLELFGGGLRVHLAQPRFHFAQSLGLARLAHRLGHHGRDGGPAVLRARFGPREVFAGKRDGHGLFRGPGRRFRWRTLLPHVSYAGRALPVRQGRLPSAFDGKEGNELAFDVFPDGFAIAASLERAGQRDRVRSGRRGVGAFTSLREHLAVAGGALSSSADKPLRYASVRIAPSRFAPVAPSRFAPTRIAPSSLARVRSAPKRFAPRGSPGRDTRRLDSAFWPTFGVRLPVQPTDRRISRGTLRFAARAGRDYHLPSRERFMATAALTVTEVVAFSGLDEGKVRKDVEHGLFGNDSPPTFNVQALIYFRSLALWTFSFRWKTGGRCTRRSPRRCREHAGPTRSIWGRVWESEIGQGREGSHGHARTLHGVEVEAGRHQPEDPRRRAGILEESPFGSAIGALVMNDAIDEIREDYPYLSEEDIEFAKLYALAYPGAAGRVRANLGAER